MALHPSTEQVLRGFKYQHLREGVVRNTSRSVADFADFMRQNFELQGIDGPELTVAFRKLLEAKDAFVRAVVYHEEDQAIDAAERDAEAAQERAARDYENREAEAHYQRIQEYGTPGDPK